MLGLMLLLNVAHHTNQAILARQGARDEFGQRYGIVELRFAPPAIAGSSFSLIAAAPTWLLAAVASLLCILLGDACEQLQLFQPVPPEGPLRPRLTHVCLTSRLLPIPRAIWR